MFKSLRERLSSWRNKLASEDATDGDKGNDLPDEKTSARKPQSPLNNDDRATTPAVGHTKGTKPPQDIYSDSFFAQRLNEEKLEDLLWELEIALMESDVAVPVIEEIKKKLKKDIAGKKIRRDVPLDEAIEIVLREAVTEAMSLSTEPFDAIVTANPKPVILLFVGINGTGKTTTIAKLVNRFQKNGLTCVIAAGDTFRAGAIEQLERHSEKLGVKLIKHKAGADAAAVAYDAIEHAKARHRDIVLIDSAGRMQTNQNLMDEMEKIKRVAKPTMTIFVGDAIAGNDVVEQARTFAKGIGIDGVILNKIDADVKGGAALSIAHTINKPIFFVGTGQGYNDLEEFSPDWMTKRLFSD